MFLSVSILMNLIDERTQTGPEGEEQDPLEALDVRAPIVSLFDMWCHSPEDRDSSQRPYKLNSRADDDAITNSVPQMSHNDVQIQRNSAHKAQDAHVILLSTFVNVENKASVYYIPKLVVRVRFPVARSIFPQ